VTCVHTAIEGIRVGPVERGLGIDVLERSFDVLVGKPLNDPLHDLYVLVGNRLPPRLNVLANHGQATPLDQIGIVDSESCVHVPAIRSPADRRALAKGYAARCDLDSDERA
jgi:hypothetical protein